MTAWLGSSIFHAFVGQKEGEDGAFAGPSVHVDPAAVLFDDAVADGQSQPRSFPDFLGGVERVEDPGDVFLRDAGSLVPDFEVEAVLRLVLPSPQVQLPAPVHGLHAVDDQVDQHLLEALGVQVGPDVLGNVHADADVSGHLAFEQPEGPVHQRLQDHRLPAEGTLPGELQQPLDDVPGPFHLLFRFLQQAPLEFQVRLFEFLQHDLYRGGDVVERIVQLVGHAGGEGAQGGELFDLDQMLAAPVEFIEHVVQAGDQGFEFVAVGHRRDAGVVSPGDPVDRHPRWP